MKSMHQTPTLVANTNPFARGYHNLHVERLLLVTFEDDCPPCFRPLHDSQAHLPDNELQLFPCVFNDDFALISEGQSIPEELGERCQSTGLVCQVFYAVIGEVLNEQYRDLYSLQEAQAVIHRLNFETGHYSRAWEISTVHLPEEALLYLEGAVSAPKQTGLLFELFRVPDCDGIGCKLIGTPWTDENLQNIEGKPYSNLRQEQIDAGTPEVLVKVLYLAALADVRLLIFDPSAAVLSGLDVFDE